MLQNLTDLAIPEIAAIARRLAFLALGLAVVGVGIGLLVHEAVVGIGVAVGLSLAFGNFQRVVAAVVKASKSDNPNKKRPLAMNTFARLGLVSVIALALVYFVRPLGFGALVGLALFELALLANVTVAVLRSMKAHTGGPL
jgi:hypothetical protein